jgi:CDI immunity proteins
MIPEIPARLEWLKPWERLKDSGDGFVKELQREMPTQHILHGVPVVAVAHRIDCDDVLFATADPSKPLAVVHLAYHGPETDPKWPWTALYESWQDWIEGCLFPDHEDYFGRFDRGKSLQELEQENWTEPTYDSHLVTTIHNLRRKLLVEFTVEDLRIMIGQGISLPFLIPLAIERLEEEPLAAGDLYRGDLLQAMVLAGEAYWANHPNYFQRFHKVILRVNAMYGSSEKFCNTTSKEDAP